MHQQQTAFENIVGKGEIAHNKQFLLFPQCFLLNQIIVSPFVYIFDIISSIAAELKEPKIGISGTGLKCHLQSVSIWTSLKFCRLLKCSVPIINALYFGKAIILLHGKVVIIFSFSI